MHRFTFVIVLWLVGGDSSLLALAERDVRHEFPVQPGCTLKLDTYRGAVTIVESDEPIVRVHVHLEIGGQTEADSDRILAGLQLDVQARDNVVSIFARNPRETRVRWIWREDEQIDLTYRITVPRQCHVDVRNINGAVTVGRVTGNVTAEVENGTVFFRGVDGGAKAVTQEGDVIISRCTGDVTARTRKGVIRIGVIGGTAKLRTTNGDIEVMTAKGPISAESEVGDLVVGFPRLVTGPVSLVTGQGDVFARLDPLADGALDAAATWGRVECTLPIAAEPGASKSRLRGKLNAGGALLTLRSRGGNVRIERGETVFE